MPGTVLGIGNFDFPVFNSELIDDRANAFKVLESNLSHSVVFDFLRPRGL